MYKFTNLKYNPVKKNTDGTTSVLYFVQRRARCHVDVVDDASLYTYASVLLSKLNIMFSVVVSCQYKVLRAVGEE